MVNGRGCSAWLGLLVQAVPAASSRIRSGPRGVVPRTDKAALQTGEWSGPPDQSELHSKAKEYESGEPIQTPYDRWPLQGARDRARRGDQERKPNEPHQRVQDGEQKNERSRRHVRRQELRQERNVENTDFGIE